MSILDDNTTEWDLVLTTSHGLAVLEDVHSREEPVVSLDELASSLDAESDASDSRRRLAVHLHHVTLPELDEAGVLDYDASDHRIEYQERELTTEFLDLLQED